MTATVSPSQRTKGLAATLVAVGLAAVTAVSASAASGGATHASAVLFNAAGARVGTAVLTEDADGKVHVNIKADGLAEGLHGTHVHNTGSCLPTFSAAGSHHNPANVAHGQHAGDLPNLVVNAGGRGTLNTTTERATLTAGPLSVFDLDGASVIIHAGLDDGVTDPTGNSGARIACGVLVPWSISGR